MPNKPTYYSLSARYADGASPYEEPEPEATETPPTQKDSGAGAALVGMAALGSLLFGFVKSMNSDSDTESPDVVREPGVSRMPGILPPDEPEPLPIPGSQRTPVRISVNSTVSPTQASSPSMWKPVTAPFLLTTGKRYCARIALNGAVKAFANAALIRAKLENAGFKNVIVWMDAAELPPYAPAMARTLEGPFAVGTWSGATQETILPSQIAHVWEQA